MYLHRHLLSLNELGFNDAIVLIMPSVYDVGAALLVCVSVCMVDSSNSSSVGGAIVVDDVDGGDDD